MPTPRRCRFESLESREVLSVTVVEPPSILFIRGGDRTGGFLESPTDFSRTEQLADINNAATFGGNHGWAELRESLETAGFTVSQITEGSETASGPADGIAIDFSTFDFTPYDAIVFGSNNAVYTQASVDAVEAYIRGGGSALFISDANFGSDWADASNSDQQFLDRFGLIVHQDQGTYQLSRSGGEYLVGDHPLFTNVNTIDGEGVTPIRVGSAAPGVEVTILAEAEGNTRLNEPPFGFRNIGDSRASTTGDAAVLVADVDDGKLVGHFDRNTFFNLNGAGTNLNRFDNEQYALNLFGWMVGAFDPLPGDYDDDGFVTEFDLPVWRSAYGTVGASAADGNGDGRVDAADYTVWRDNLGASRPLLNLTPSATARATAQAMTTPIVSPTTPPPVTTATRSTDASERAFDRPIDPALLLLATGVVDGPNEGEPAVEFPAEPTDEQATDTALAEIDWGL